MFFFFGKLGVHSIDNMMKNISIRANLSQIYTNHCIRATTTTVLAHADIQHNDIIAVTGHKDPKSLIPYVTSTRNNKEEICLPFCITLARVWNCQIPQLPQKKDNP